MSSAKTISLDAFRERKKREEQERRLYGTMVWLHCPTCKRIEYTEVVAPGGRTHNCGTFVEEVNVEVDMRAEVTITQHNIGHLEKLLEDNGKYRLKKLLAKSMDKVLQDMKSAEETYLARLMIASRYQAKPYEGDFDSIKETLPIKTKNAIGLYISDFRFEPHKRFPSLSKK